MDLTNSTSGGESWWIEGFVSCPGGGLDLVERVGLVADPYRESDPFPWWQGGTTTWLETREEQINRAPHWSKACWGFKLVKRRAVELGRWGEGWTRGELS